MHQSQDSTLLSKLNVTGAPQKKLQHRLYAKFSDSGRIMPNKRGDSTQRTLVLADETLISSIPDRGMKKSSSMAKFEHRQFANSKGELSLLAKLPKIESKKHIEYDQPPLPSLPFPRVVGKDTISPFPGSQDPNVIKSILAQYRSPALMEGRTDLGASQILSQLKHEQTGGFRSQMDQSSISLKGTLRASSSTKKLPPLKVQGDSKVSVLDQTPHTTKQVHNRALTHSQSTALILHKKKDQPLQITKTKDKKKDQNALINSTLKERGMGETPFSFIKLIQADPNFQNQFCYCIRGGDFYDFKIVPFKEKEEKHNNKEFMTVSSRGIIHFIKGEGNFMTIPEWEREARLFQKIKKISFFENYRTWKTFSAWKTLMRRTMIFKTSDFLNRELFILDSELAKPLLEIRRQTFKIQSMYMTQMTTERPRTKQEFDEAQQNQRVGITQNLSEIEKNIKIKLMESCDSSMKTFKEENRISLNENQEEEDNEEAEPFLVGDETHKQMPYTQEATTRTHYKKLAKYIRLTDYMLIQAKLRLISNSIAETHMTLQRDFTSGQKVRCEGKLQASPLFEVIIGFQGLSITFSPSKNELKESIRNTITDGVDAVCKYELFLNQPEFEIYTSAQEFDDHLFDETNDLMALAIGSEFIFKETEHAANRIELVFEQIEHFSELYTKFLEMYDRNKQVEMETFRDQDPQTIQNTMDEFIKESEEIDELETKFKIKICSLDATSFKKTMRVSPVACINKLKEFLPSLVYDKVVILCEKIKIENEKVKKKPTKIDEFVTIKKNLIELQEVFDNYMIEFGEIRSFNQLMDERHIKQPEKNKQKVKETDDFIKSTKKLMEVGLDDSEVHEMKFKKDLQDQEVPRLKRECKAIDKEVQNDKFKTLETDMTEACNQLEEMKVDVDNVIKRSKDLNNFQEYLETAQTDFTVTQDLLASWKSTRNMWCGLRDWIDLCEGWVKTQFLEIDVAVMQPLVDKYSKQATEVSLDSDLKDTDVSALFSEKVNTIKSTMPIVTSLRDPHMKAAHFNDVNKIVGRTIDLEAPDFNLQYLIDMDVKRFVEEIQEIQTRAVREDELQEAFDKVKEEWSNMPIELTRPKDRDDYWILSGLNIEQVRELLEDTMVRISNIQNAKHVDLIKEEVSKKYKELSEMDNLLTEFLECQKNFTYLSNILRGDIIRDLPKEYNVFQEVNKDWKTIMDHVQKKASQSALGILKPIAGRKNLLFMLQEDNKKLERIQHSLDTMLASKRTDFGRFYFLSNDELLQILAEASTNPECIQAHLRKIFENVNKVVFRGQEEIIQMSSAEGEEIVLRPVKLKQGGTSKVEQWLNFLLDSMKAAVKKFIVDALNYYAQSAEEKNFKRVQWVMDKSLKAQAVTVAGSILWAKTTEDDIAMQGDEPCEGIQISLTEHISNLEDLTKEVAKVNMEQKKRKAVVALITQDVHYRDILEELVQDQVESPNDFKWQMQLRYIYDSGSGDVKVRQVNAELAYANEYMGCTTRLVITPLTDRCWMTITGALQIKLGAAPAGPAGTGKTESTKDLAKGLGTFCVVFNCSDQINYKMMEQLFAGLASTGSWACLDEFNRIDIEVLSVVAQQLLTIRNYLLYTLEENAAKLELEIGITKIPKPDEKLGVFITMNPGYKGRTELPDNLKVLFRPVSMMIPDYALIAEIMLFAEGFQQAKPLSRKMTRLYSLASEQLSQQPHYDFGMRAVKSVLVMAGQVKRAEESLSEDMVLIRAMRDSNIPKFLKDDVPLFNAIIQDLFPGIVMEPNRYPELDEAIEAQFINKGLINDATLREKIIQFNETMNVRFGLMIIGPAMTGKTTVIHALKDAMNYLAETYPNKGFEKVQMETLNPKSISMAELYGSFSQTQEWTDGLASNIIRQFVDQDNLEMKWTVFDGPVDALWIENMNTVLDDNMTLCLSNGERIRLKPCMKMVFEVDNLAQASPATVSRCGMVYASPSTLSWNPIVRAWLNKNLDVLFNEKQQQYFWNMFENSIDQVIDLVRGKEFKEPIPTVDNNHVTSMLRLIEAFLTNVIKLDKYDQEKQKKTMNKIFIYALAWSFGGSIDSQHHSSFEVFLSMAFNVSDLPRNSIFDSVFKTDGDTLEFQPWTNTMPQFEFSKQKSYFELVVPTKDTVRYSWLLTQNILCKFPVFITGITGVGKSIIITDTIQKLKAQNTHEGIFMSFSSQTAARETQLSIEEKLEKRKRNLLVGPNFKKVVLFIDDINMPAYDLFGTQAPIELARTLCDFMFVYDRSTLEKKFIADTTLVVCAAPPEGGRKILTQRFTRHFHTLCLPPTQEDSLEMIFSSILNGFLGDFKQEIKGLTKNLVQSSIQIFQACSAELRPTPAKSHYTFNLRDISKIFQGICMSKPQSMQRQDKMILLWIHEASRVFFDRLTTEEDKDWFNKKIFDLATNNLRLDVTFEDIFVKKQIMFCDFMKRGLAMPDRQYDEVKEFELAVQKIKEYEMMYNEEPSNTNKFDLVMFPEAMQHICRITRILRQPRGSVLLVGVGGSGKQTLTRLSSFISECQFFNVEVKKNYGLKDFRLDLKKPMMKAGASQERSLFLLNDNQITDDSFLEDINNLLNSGEIQGIWETEDKELIHEECIEKANKLGIDFYQYFVQKMRDNLNIVLCLSPVGESFRKRIRMFPSLVNCCGIDWVFPWPEQALYSVAKFFIGQSKDIQNPELQDKIARMCMFTHHSVIAEAEKFYASLKRNVYVTPKSYLDLLKSYDVFLQEKKKLLQDRRDTLFNGLTKLEETNAEVTKLTQDLTEMQPNLEKQVIEQNQLSLRLDKDKVEANKKKEVVEGDKRVVAQKTAEVVKQSDEANFELRKVDPIVKEATDAVERLTSKDITDAKTMQNPSDTIKCVFQLLYMILIKWLPQEKIEWKMCQQMINGAQFFHNIKSYDRDNLDKALRNKVDKFIREQTALTDDSLKKASTVALSLGKWAKAIVDYSKIAEKVAPLRTKVAALTKALNEQTAKLKAKEDELAVEEAKVKGLEEAYQKAKEDMEALEHGIELCKARLVRAEKLTNGLKNEHGRWKESVAVLDDKILRLSGDVFIATAGISYYGPFTGTFRDNLCRQWVEQCNELEIPSSDQFDMAEVMGDPMEIQNWNLNMLPSDQVSVASGILVKYGQKKPLLIDPQLQASKWLKTQYAGEGLKVVRNGDPKLMQALEQCVKNGKRIMIEDVGESTDPILEPVLLNQQFRSGSTRWLIKLEEGNSINFDPAFMLYLATKMPNPHYLPESFIRVNVINFTVTQEGLVQQLLAEIVRLERPDIETKKLTLTKIIVEDQLEIKKLEDDILDQLVNSGSNILDDQDLIDNLERSKVKSQEISERMEQNDIAQEEIRISRNQYLVVSERGSIIYFVIADMAGIDPMYQYSLSYFIKLFTNVIKAAAKSDDIEERIATLMKDITFTIFSNICRGLFNTHKLIFSFMLAAKIQLEANEARSITPAEWDLFLKGVLVDHPDVKTTRRPTGTEQKELIFDEKTWRFILNLEQTHIGFTGLSESINKNLDEWIAWIKLKEPQHESLPDDWSHKLTQFQQMLVFKAFRQEKINYLVQKFVENELGHDYAHPSPPLMEDVYAGGDKTTPIIYVLSTGAEPTSLFLRFAKKTLEDAENNYTIISLGQGQQEAATRAIDEGMREGKWVLLQNCHLFKSFMSTLEKKVLEISEGFCGKVPIKENFRLFLTSMPVAYFPVSVLQNGIKMTNEPPKGLRANMIGSLAQVQDDLFFPAGHKREGAFKALLFSVSFFHAIIQERRKFGPLGWNTRYEFNESDLETAQKVLRDILQQDTEDVLWQALNFVTGQIVYGGRVTDYWDRRCLMTILNTFFNDNVLDADYKFSQSGTYTPVQQDELTLEAMQLKAQNLPTVDSPEIFGMHDNADIAFQLQESIALIDIVLSVQPRTSSGEGSRNPDTIVDELSNQILAQLPEPLTREGGNKELFVINQQSGLLHSLTIFLLQEVDRFNELLRTMESSLKILKNAIKGLAVMSEDLDLMYTAMLQNKVPKLWSDKAYPSLKSLGSWVENLVQRIEFIRMWIVKGKPIAYWFSSFFFPQGFMTALLQSFARKYTIPIDILGFKFTVFPFYTPDQVNRSAGDGVYIYGLFMECGQLDRETLLLTDASPGQKAAIVPMIQLHPKNDYTPSEEDYTCPLYKTSERAGTLTTTGHSTNFVIGIDLSSLLKPEHWIKRGTALLCQLDD